MRHSQNNEEEVILSCFPGRVGRFLDIGANDGETFSNTRALALGGWTGVLVEPSPLAFAKLSGLYPFGQTLLNVAVGLADGEIEFFENTDTLVSTAVEAEKARWGSAFHPIRVKMVTTASLLATAPGPYDFISIDCEGLDVDVLRGFPPSLRESAVICIEHNSVASRKEEILRLLPEHQVLLDNPENLVLAPKKNNLKPS